MAFSNFANILAKKSFYKYEIYLFKVKIRYVLI